MAINTKMCSFTRIFKNFNHCFTVLKFEKREKLTTIGGRFMKQRADPLPTVSRGLLLALTMFNLRYL